MSKYRRLMYFVGEKVITKRGVVGTIIAFEKGDATHKNYYTLLVPNRQSEYIVDEESIEGVIYYRKEVSYGGNKVRIVSQS